MGEAEFGVVCQVPGSAFPILVFMMRGPGTNKPGGVLHVLVPTPGPPSPGNTPESRRGIQTPCPPSASLLSAAAAEFLVDLGVKLPY